MIQPYFSNAKSRGNPGFFYARAPYSQTTAMLTRRNPLAGLLLIDRPA